MIVITKFSYSCKNIMKIILLCTRLQDLSIKKNTKNMHLAKTTKWPKYTTIFKQNHNKHQ